MIRSDKIVHVSTWETVKMHFLSFTYGLYFIMKLVPKWAWDRKKFFMMQQRDKPPPCLVDNSLGTHSHVKVKGVKFHYVEAGDKDKPLILLLHGFPDCWLSWRKQIPCLAEHYRIVAIDLKGFGDSDKPSTQSSYRIKILVEELKQFILTLGSKQCSIIGHDLGGLLGWYMAALHEDLVQKFVAISCPHPNLYWNRMSGNFIFDLKWLHFSRLPFLPEIDALREDLSIINNAFQLNQKNNENSYLEAYKYAFSRKEDWIGALNYYRSLPFIKLNIDSCEQMYVKVLLIVGQADPLVTIESMIQSSEYVEKFNVKVIPGARHFPHQEEPDEVNKTILKFFIGTTNTVQKIPPTNIVSSWLGSLNHTVKYGNQVFDTVLKRTNGVVNVLPSKAFYFGQTTN